jgi:hypothetical protein
VNVLAIGCLASALVSAACSASQVSVACSDQAFVALAAECSARVARCKVTGGNEDECAPLCDADADDWAKRCGQ